MDKPYHSASYDFRLLAQPEARPMKIGKTTVVASAICGSDDQTIVVRGADLCRDLIGKISFVDYFFLLVTGQRPGRRPAVCSMRRWWRSPSTAWCPACRPRA